MAGIKNIFGQITVSCPHCHNALDLSGFGVEVFRRVLEALQVGERVQISNFGSFQAKPIEKREFTGVDGERHEMAARKVIRFRAAHFAKKFVNASLKEKKKKKGKK